MKTLTQRMKKTKFATHSVVAIVEKVPGGALVNFLVLPNRAMANPADYAIRTDGRVVIPGNADDELIGVVEEGGIFLTHAEAASIGA